MNKCIIACIAALLSLAAAGCNIWIKRGAGHEQLSLDQTECRTQADSDQPSGAYLECMRGRGWYHQDKTFVPSVPDAVISPEALTTHSGSPLQDRPTIEVQGTPDEYSETEVATGDDLQKDESTVGSWWKIGGSPEQLMQDQNSCQSELGTADKERVLQWSPNSAFVHCMKDKGWYAVTE